MSPGANPPPPRILVVDDEPQFREVITYSLAGQYQVQTRENAEAALELLKQEDFLLVITDYMMPGMNGLELLDHVRQLPGFTAGLLVTAHMEVLAKPEWLEGRASILFKPFTRDALNSAVQQMIGLAQMRRRIRSGLPASPTSRQR